MNVISDNKHTELKLNLQMLKVLKKEFEGRIEILRFLEFICFPNVFYVIQYLTYFSSSSKICSLYSGFPSPKTKFRHLSLSLVFSPAFNIHLLFIQIYCWSWGSSVSIVPDHRLKDHGSIIRQGKTIFPLASASRPAVRLTQPPTHCVTEVHFRG
jgi:hypothetical protein